MRNEGGYDDDSQKHDVRPPESVIKTPSISVETERVISAGGPNLVTCPLTNRCSLDFYSN